MKRDDRAIAAALAMAAKVHANVSLRAPDPQRATERWAIGDPQAPISTFMHILHQHGLLAEDGWLRRDVQLLSIGDHFDGPQGRPAEVAAFEGECLLSWLAAHDAYQVTLLLGNHDFARVNDLVCAGDQ